MDLKFRIINTTVKPVKLDSKGKDIRKAIEKIGHPVKFKDKEKDVILQQGQVRLVSELNSGILSLKRADYVRVEEIKDMVDALKDHVYKAPVEETTKEESKVRAVEMGLDDYKQTSGNEYEGAVNPDGNPNFLVKAKRKKNATSTDSNAQDGEGAEVSKVVP